MRKKFFICGGDMRFVKLAEKLEELNYDVCGYGFDKIESSKNIMCATLKEGISDADYIILPLPAVMEGIYVNTPLSCKKLLLQEVLHLCTKDQILFAGMACEELFEYRCYDYFNREELAIQNAIPSVEGALQIAMEETPITIWGSNCLVLGYGRIGKLLSKSLRDLGAKVTTEARKFDDLAWIETEGCTPLHLNRLNQSLAGFDIIFNTIPHRILTQERLDLIGKDTLIIDLASKPGGVDFEYASQTGKKVIWALSLPGRVAPTSSGIIILKTIFNIIEELEVSP